MEKQKIYYVIAAVIIIILIIAGLYVLTNEKGKFVGTWKNSEGTITFNNDDTATFDGDIIGTFILIDLTGTINYKIANQQVTFTAESIQPLKFDYIFLDSNTLKLTKGENSITLTKI